MTEPRQLSLDFCDSSSEEESFVSPAENLVNDFESNVVSFEIIREEKVRQQMLNSLKHSGIVEFC